MILGSLPVRSTYLPLLSMSPCLKVRSEAVHVLVVGEDRVAGRAEEVVVPDAEQAEE